MAHVFPPCTGWEQWVWEADRRQGKKLPETARAGMREGWEQVALRQVDSVRPERAVPAEWT